MGIKTSAMVMGTGMVLLIRTRVICVPGAVPDVPDHFSTTIAVTEQGGKM